MKQKCVYAQIREELLDQGDVPPTIKGYLPYHVMNSVMTFRAYQPDELDSAEFNTIIYVNRKKHRVNSIDFDFFNDKKEAEKHAEEVYQRVFSEKGVK